MDSFVPALLASSNFGIPLIDEVFLPSVFFKELDSLNLANSITCSIIPHFANFFKKVWFGIYFEPNLSGFKVQISFVWLENVGFSNVEFIKNIKLSFNNWLFTFISLFFFLIISIKYL